MKLFSRRSLITSAVASTVAFAEVKAYEAESSIMAKCKKPAKSVLCIKLDGQLFETPPFSWDTQTSQDVELFSLGSEKEVVKKIQTRITWTLNGEATASCWQHQLHHLRIA